MSAQEFILIPKNYIKHHQKRQKLWMIQQLQQKVNNLRYYNEFPKKRRPRRKKRLK